VDDDEFAKLVEAVAAYRDREAFAQLHAHFAPRIHALFLRSGVEPSVAEDLTQEVMTRLWRRAHRYDRRKGLVSTWLFRIARNLRIDYFRGQRGDPPLGDAALSIPDTTIIAPDEALNSAQLHEQVRAALSKLPAGQLAMIRMAYFEGLSHSEISAQTGLPLGTVKGRLRAALARLRDGLNDGTEDRSARKICENS
jgi:RNA polymerase sigma factor (sigma-70 family)